MKTQDQRSQVERLVLEVLPSSAHDLARLRVLTVRGAAPVVTVVGKYNHGKSRLLNELVGRDAFVVADRRETVCLSDHVHQAIRWLDAPGLDADISGADDDHARRAVWLESDVRLFVHAAKEGELDADERQLLHTLRADEERTQRQTICVLTQVDQLPDDASLQKVVSAIERQAPGVPWVLVSSSRHRKGVDERKTLWVEKSGFPALRSALATALAAVPGARIYEQSYLLQDLQAQLKILLENRREALKRLCLEQAQQRTLFDQDLCAVQARVRAEIAAVLAVPGPDHSLTPDSFDNQFKLTPGKLERNRLQVAYSKACIQISAILTKHGAMELPLAQQTQVKSLDSVMVAVMGVSVKYRKDLQNMFCEEQGQARLKAGFERYFESSSDRQALALRIGQARAAADAAEQAQEALHYLEMTA